MKHTNELYKKIFTKLYIRYGYHPFPKEFLETGIDEVLSEWDEELGEYKEEHIMEGLKNCIMENEEKMPRLPKIKRYVEEAMLKANQESFFNPQYGDQSNIGREPTEDELNRVKKAMEKLNGILGKVREVAK